MRKNNLKVLKKPNNNIGQNEVERLLNGPAKAPNVSTTSLSESKRLMIERKNSAKKSSWKDDRELNDILQIGIDLKNEEDYPGAIRAFAKAIRKSPRCSMAYWLLGGIYHTFLHDSKSSIPYFKKAVKLLPKSQSASLGLFHALWDTNQINKALNEIKRYQLLSNWSCQDYLEIVEEINEKWVDSPKTKTKAKTRK